MAGVSVSEEIRLDLRIPRGAQGYWDVIRVIGRSGRTFAMRDIKDVFHLINRWVVGDNGHCPGQDDISEYISRLVKGGYITKKNGMMELVKDAGQCVPRLKRDGSPTRAATGQDYMWRAIRMNKVFSPKELMIAASTDAVKITMQTAKDYIKHLKAAGYLKVVTPHQGGRKAAVYRLYPNRATGPAAPQVMRDKRVYDPNIKRVMTPQAAKAPKVTGKTTGKMTDKMANKMMGKVAA